MLCPICGGKSIVVDCIYDGDGVYRRRKCKECGRVFFTTESDSDSFMYHDLKSKAQMAGYYRRKNKNEY